MHFISGISTAVAITHFTPQLIGRGGGRSVVLAAAYRHCARMEHEAEARTVDYTGKRGMIHEAFLLPPNAPAWARALVADRSVAGSSEAFWNRVEAFEKRADAQFAKEFIVALPVELSREQNIALVDAFVETQVLGRGQVADWVFHDDPGNPHVHLMTTLRPLTEDGFGRKKVAVIGEDGRPLRNAAGKLVYRLWSGDRSEFLEQRQAWLDLQNRHLALAGLDVRVDGRSYTERGLDLAPTSHIGVAAKAIERKEGGEGWGPSLERLRAFEDGRAENARRIERRPEIVLDLISREKSVFDQRDVAKILHRWIDDAATFQTLLARILQSPEVLRLEAETIDFASGARTPSRYTTRELIRLEAEMACRATHLANTVGFEVKATERAAIFERHTRLSAEQRTAIEHVTSSERIAAVVGRAGAGKTTMMTAGREVWEAAGYRVVGAALAGKAAEGLETEAGITSHTLSSWELRWAKGRDLLDDKTVLVLDEAGMVSSRQMAIFVEAVANAGAKLVLVGDPDQLQPIEAGAAFRALTERIGYAELETIHRQREPWMRTASLDLARGRVAEALRSYRDKGKIIGAAVKAEAIATLIADWNREHDPTKSTLILAHLRRDVRTLNDMARARLVERDLVGRGHLFRTADGERRFDVGDQIVFLRNEGSLGVKNGMIGRVVAAEPRRFTAEIGEGANRRRVEIDQSFYTDVDHGYATTIHKAQGATVDRVKVLATLSLDRHLSYVAMTRHREDATLYYGRRSFETVGGLGAILSQRRAKETTLDYARGGFYGPALRFAEARGLHLVRVARTLVRDRIQWTIRQKQRLADLGRRLAAFGRELGLATRPHSPEDTVKKELRPMVAGITTFTETLGSAVETRVLADPGVGKQWGEVTNRFRFVFADPEAAFRALDLDKMSKDPTAATTTLERLATRPETFGALRGKTGLLASKADRDDRRRAEVNVPALRRDLERWLRLRAEAETKFEAEERAIRQRAALDIPALSAEAARMLERVRDAIDRNDLPAGLEFALADRMVKAEINGFAKVVTKRFGERAFLNDRAKEPIGPIFEKLASGLSPAQREQLASAWPTMRTAQQLAAHERTAVAMKQAEALRRAQKPGQVLQ